MSDWLNPMKNIPAMFSKKTAFGLNPLNIGGKADPDRAPFTAMGTTGLKDAQEVVDKEKAANAKVIADAEALKAKSASQAKESILSKQRAISRNKTTYTSPLGLGEEATTVKKTLLGQ